MTSGILRTVAVTNRNVGLLTTNGSGIVGWWNVTIGCLQTTGVTTGGIGMGKRDTARRNHVVMAAITVLMAYTRIRLMGIESMPTRSGSLTLTLRLDLMRIP